MLVETLDLLFTTDNLPPNAPDILLPSRRAAVLPLVPAGSESAVGKLDTQAVEIRLMQGDQAFEPEDLRL